MGKNEKFIETIAPEIRKQALAAGYQVVSPIIAQACVESAYGTSSLGYKYHNYFGIKCGNSWKGKSVNLKTKEEYTAGTLTTIRDNFRAYDSMQQGISGYFKFISGKRYNNLKTAVTPKQYLERIKADGYATSSSYVKTCMQVVDAYNLTRYDGLQSCPYACPTKTIKAGSQGTGVKWLQWHLNRLVNAGVLKLDKLDIDGSCGPKTQTAIKSFQRLYPETGTAGKPDGSCGPKMRAKLQALELSV